jgi:hypothetical protein
LSCLSAFVNCEDATPFYLAIRRIIGEHDLLIDETPIEEWEELRRRFWNEYVYPRYEAVYFELFPDEKTKKDDLDRSKGDLNILEYNQKIAIALCEWLKREGFFHFFEGEVIFIAPDPTDLAFVLTDGVAFRRYPPQYVGKLLEQVASDRIDDGKKISRLEVWVTGLALLAGILIWVLISAAIGR